MITRENDNSKLMDILHADFECDGIAGIESVGYPNIASPVCHDVLRGRFQAAIKTRKLSVFSLFLSFLSSMR